MSARILWLSRHAMLPLQLAALQQLWPGCVVETRRFHAVSFDDGAEVLRLVAEGQYDEVAIVAPLSYIQRLVDAGLRPLWADMVPAGAGPADLVLPGDRRLRFAGWRRVVGVRLQLEDVGVHPPPPRGGVQGVGPEDGRTAGRRRS